MCNTHYYDVNVFFEDAAQYDEGKKRLQKIYAGHFGQTKRVKKLNKAKRVITIGRCLAVSDLKYRLHKEDILYKEAHLAKKGE